ncbi:MAG: 3-phosphoshikimate 1-carboxyvinyltransferase [Candidatus Cloacimonetes bacterium]|nr:3-phosphoshikimate 1-carboxyvinyltransferase [Candidatus Cloacimonadota bacterium]MCF7813727.1 3-phosphoshikimate 1-carboxyvinyltransferase [Candidatus Cloacimonadota bacterium]MCF7867793.1 3-phosphoshikimate 1-carboxyvinyltransferase [Candidatus Cloacimonadota bacterium]MCF7883229.1 3-phosphoshikimate 1-carboxyvinyltransferase [Candidatus Cloacimonadota bacterium]
MNKSKHRMPIKIQASKSILNRLLIIATMMDKPLKFRNFSNCDDIRTMTENLFILGYNIIERGDFLTISKTHDHSGKVQLSVRDSATAARFLLARLSVWEGLKSKLELTEQLQKRPLKTMIDALKKLGAEIDMESYPINIVGKNIIDHKISIDAGISSQFVSALMLISPELKNGLKIELENEIVSKDYINMTAEIMRDFGVDVIIHKDFIEIPQGQKYEQKEIYNVEPDYSSAAYFWAIGANSEYWIATEPISENSLQPDYGFLEILKKMGASVKIQNEMIWVKKGELHGIEFDMKHMPDQVPTLAVLAIFAKTPTKIKNINHLRYKESDRIKSIQSELAKLGVQLKYEEEHLIVLPCNKLNTSKILSSHNDHRIAMSLFILKIIYPEIQIDDLNCINKSNPDFLENMNSLIVNS